MRILLIAALLSVLSACGTAVKSYNVASFQPAVLAPEHEVFVKLVTADEVSGHPQAVLACQDVAFRIGAMGVRVAGSPENADIYADFSIGTVRYDLISGWIADRAFLEIREASSGIILASYHAKARFITPTTRNLVSNLAREMEKDLR